MIISYKVQVTGLPIYVTFYLFFFFFYIHVTVHRNRFLLKQPTRRNNYPNLFCYKTLHVSRIFSAHHQEFSTVYSALESFMQVF